MRVVCHAAIMRHEAGQRSATVVGQEVYLKAVQAAQVESGPAGRAYQAERRGRDSERRARGNTTASTGRVGH